MASVCALGSFMSSTAVTAIFIPVAMRISQNTGAPTSRLMMPLSTAALISGMMTLVATAPNLVVNAELERHLREKGAADATGFHFFSFTPFGLPILGLGIVYMLFARRWLTNRQDAARTESGRPSMATWVQAYQLAGREHRQRLLPATPIVGQTISDVQRASPTRANVLAIERVQRRDTVILQPTEKTELLAGDILLLDVPSPTLHDDEFLKRKGLEPLPLAGAYFDDRTQDLGMAELIVPDDSNLIGKTIVESEFRSRTGLTVIGLRRRRQAISGNLRDEKIEIGDTLLVIGPWKQIEGVSPDRAGALILRLPTEIQEVLAAPGKAIYAVVCLALVVGLMVSGVIPNVQAALIGCLLMGAFGCVTLVSAYRAIDWKTIVLIVGMLPFSLALQRTGGVDLMANGLASMIGGAGPRVALGTVFALTAILGMFISNTATAVLMAPVAIALSKDLSLSPYPFAMIVALAASTAFMTPVSSPVNTLVVTPGNYTFGDFVKIGTPFSLIVLLICVIMVPWLLPL